MDLTRVIHRFRLRAAGFRLAEDAEAPPSASMTTKSKLLVAELRSMLGKRERELKGDPRGHQALVELDHALRKYNPHASATMGAEREIQFLLLLIQKELDAEVIDHGEVADLAKRFVRLLG